MGKGKDGLSRAQRRGDIPPPAPATEAAPEEPFVVEVEEVPRHAPSEPAKLTGADKWFDRVMLVGIAVQFAAMLAALATGLFLSAQVGVTVGFWAALAGWPMVISAMLWFRVYRQLGEFVCLGGLFSAVTVAFGLAKFVDPWWIGPCAGVALVVAGVWWVNKHPNDQN